MLIGEPYWRQLPATDEIAQACGVSSTTDFLTLPGLVSAFDDLGYDVVEWYWRTRKAGTDMRPRNG